MSRPGYVYHLREPVGYEDGWSMQRNLADAVLRGAMPDTVLLLEHAPVITLGRRTEPGELHVPNGAEVEIVETDRGGKSTYHGPGQLVCYPILDLTRHGKDVRRYVRELEEAIVRTLAPFGLEATTIEGLTGVWMPIEPIFRGGPSTQIPVRPSIRVASTPSGVSVRISASSTSRQ